MGNLSTHTASAFGGSALGAAVLGIMVSQFHMDAGLATNWLIVVGTVIVGPLTAYLAARSKTNPALAAALAGLSESNGEQPASVSATPTQTVVTNPPAAPAMPTPVPPPQPVAPAVPRLVDPQGNPA